MTVTRRSKKKTSQSVLKKIFSYGVLFSFLLVIFLKMYQVFTIDLIMKDLRSLSKQKEKLVSETARLQAEVDRLQNYDRISRIATTRLGLVANTDKVYVLRIKEPVQAERFAEQAKQPGKKKYQVAGVQ